MFWTNWVRAMCAVMVVVGIIGSLLVSFAVAKAAESVFLWMVVFAAGIIVSLSLVALTMMMTEISISLDDIRRMNASSCVAANPLLNRYVETKPVANLMPDSQKTWICDQCGTRNFAANKECMQCHASRE